MRFSVYSLIFLAYLNSCSVDNIDLSTKKCQIGKKYFNEQKYDSSIYFLNEAIKIDTLNLEAFYYLGKNNFVIGNYDLSLKYLQMAEKRNYLIDSIAELKLDLLFNLEKYDDHLRYCNELLKIDPHDFRIYFNMAKACFNKSNGLVDSDRNRILKEALKYINISINLNNKNSETLVLRGAIRYSIGDFLGSLSDFQKVINSEVREKRVLSNAYRYKGLVKYQFDEIAMAEFLLDSAIHLDTDRSILYINRGDIRLSAGKFNLACEDYRRALELGNDRALDKLQENCKDSAP